MPSRPRRRADSAAARRIPDAVFLPVDKPAYEEASADVMTVLRSTGAVVEVLGWDEAFLGVVTDDPEAFAREIQLRVREATRLESVEEIRQVLQARRAPTAKAAEPELETPPYRPAVRPPVRSWRRSRLRSGRAPRLATPRTRTRSRG